MSIALGQHTVKTDAFVGGTTTASINTSASGSTFVICCASTNATLSFSDSKGNTYTASSTPAAINYNGTFRSGYLYYCQNGTGGTGHTFSCTGGSNDSIVLFGIELTGAATSGGPDANTTPSNTGASPLVFTAITPASSNTLVLNFAGVIDATAVSVNQAGGTGGFTLVDSGEESSFGTGAAVSYILVGSPAAVKDSISFTDSSQAASFAIAFASGGGGGGGVDIAWVTA